MFGKTWIRFLGKFSVFYLHSKILNPELLDIYSKAQSSQISYKFESDTKTINTSNHHLCQIFYRIFSSIHRLSKTVPSVKKSILKSFTCTKCMFDP